jgi:acyl-CoA synthetase (AMP-forming)/AMP-acid ligase II
MSRAVLHCINTRLDAATVAFVLDHSDSKVLIADREFSPTVKAALEQLRAQGKRVPVVIDVDDPEYDGPGERLGTTEYEAFLAGGDAAFAGLAPEDEWDAIGLNYTSGTTGNPKGVVVHHRGAYLNALGNVLSWNLPRHPVYLWTLPMFHCNGWCFPWTLAAVAGTSVCLRKVDAALIFSLMREHRVSHYCGAPIVHSLLISAPAARTMSRTRDSGSASPSKWMQSFAAVSPSAGRTCARSTPRLALNVETRRPTQASAASGTSGRMTGISSSSFSVITPSPRWSWFLRAHHAGFRCRP